MTRQFRRIGLAFAIGGTLAAWLDLFASLGNEDNEKYAVEHRDIIARFGRFPHRNDALGRVCTDEELEYLKNANRFGQ